MTNSKFGKIISVVTSVCVAVMGVMLIACCAHLYYTGGNDPYSRERVGEYLGYLFVPGAITLLAVILGVVYNIINRVNTDTKVKLLSSYILSVQSKKTDIESFDDETRQAVLEERKYRASVKYIFLALSVACYAICVLYLIFFRNYTIASMTKDIMSAFAVALPFGVLGSLMNIPAFFLSEKSAERELALIKEGKKNAQNAVNQGEECEMQSDEIVIALVAKIVIIAISVMFIILGIFNGGMAGVLGKAVKICTECIGLG